MKSIAVAIFILISFFVSVQPAQAHNASYYGTGCKYGYNDGTSSGWAWKDCAGGQSVGSWQMGSSGYWYRYVYTEYHHYWWEIFNYSSWREIGYCWYDSYCVQY